MTILYRISGDEANSRFPNVLNMLVASAKEVILLDILFELPQSVGNMYDFWAKRGNSGGYVLLKSPTSVVPVIGSLIQLFLDKSHSPPHIPLKQIYAFNDLSRSNLYSAQSYVSATKQIIKCPGSQRGSNFSKKFTAQELNDVQYDSATSLSTETESNVFGSSYSTGKVLDSKPYKDYDGSDEGNAHREVETDSAPYSDDVSDRRNRHSNSSSSGSGSSSSTPRNQPQNSQRYGSDSGPQRSSNSNSSSSSNSNFAGGVGVGGASMSLGGINADDIASKCHNQLQCQYQYQCRSGRLSYLAARTAPWHRCMMAS